ncbi:hypothetical protein M5689_019696 [Euphorbia peplus]|nr:hypothetical protein M5689_019696 [Euphorbia peplus]
MVTRAENDPIFSSHTYAWGFWNCDIPSSTAPRMSVAFLPQSQLPPSQHSMVPNFHHASQFQYIGPYTSFASQPHSTEIHAPQTNQFSDLLRMPQINLVSHVLVLFA